MPYATDKVIAELFGTNRSSVTIYRLRAKIMLERIIYHKNDIRSLLSKENVGLINVRDLRNKIKIFPFWIIEINESGIYLGEDAPNELSFLTPFYSVAKKFYTEQEANNFISSISVSMSWKVGIKLIANKNDSS